MPDPTGGNDGIPFWILPYVEVRSREVAVSPHVSVLISAIVLGQVIGSLEQTPIREALLRAASAFVSSAIDDCGNTGHKPGNPPHRAGFLEAAVQTSRLASATQNIAFSRALAAASRELSGRALATPVG
jgi:hypothetical protein